MSEVKNNIDQMGIVTAILKELDKQYPGAKAEAGLFNTVIKAADLVVDEIEKNGIKQ